MTWIKKNSKTELLSFINSVEAPIIGPPTEYAGGKVLWLRHDVDYDLDHALWFAQKEASEGFAATYFLLHTAPYFDYSSDLVEKVLLLLEMGHQIGLHNDAISVWHKTGEHPRDILTRPLDFLRGICPVIGTSCHGAREHYDRGYFNYEVWKEWDRNENEGFCQVNCPQISLTKMGLEYEAYFLPYTHYFSDSGNNWVGYVVEGKKPFERTAAFSPGNLGTNVINEFNKADEGLFQMLLHPCHWECVE